MSIKRITTVIAILSLFAGCTPEQLATWESITGTKLPDSLMELDDTPLRLPDGRLINKDGTITDDTRTVVNSLPFAVAVSEPAATAYRIVAADIGWTPERIAAWEPFVLAVVQRESRFCPNVRRGARAANNGTCELTRQGSGSDSGFFQLISIHYRPGAWLCTDHNICSSDQIVSDPYTSMLVGLLLIDRSGRRPWCYTASLRAGKACRLAP